MRPAHSDLKMLLLGRTGTGKSATGNTILCGNRQNERMFRENYITQVSRKRHARVGQRTVIAVDTPGLFNPARDTEDLMTEILNGVRMSAPGPHVLLLVFRLDMEITEEERNIKTWIENNFGADAVLYTFILFTHADQLNGESVEDHIRRKPVLQLLINQCGGRYHSFNNVNRNNTDQVTELLEKIERMVQNNTGQYCSIEHFNRQQEGNGTYSTAKLLGLLGTVLVGIFALMAKRG